MTLSRSLDLDTTVAEVGRLLVPRFADWCSIQLLRDGQFETVAVQHFDPETTQWARSMRDAFPTRRDRPTGARTSCAPARASSTPSSPPSSSRRQRSTKTTSPSFGGWGSPAHSWPLNGREGVFGAVTLIHAESGRRYGDEDVAFLEEIADRVAVAFDTAALGDDLALLLASYDPSTERDLTAPDATNPRAPVDT